MTRDVVDRWIEIVHSGSYDSIADLLADDAVFFSPAVFTAQPGAERTAAYLTAAMNLFDDADFRYTQTWRSPRSAVLEFTATLDDVHVEGVDIIRWNEQNKISESKA